MNTKEEHASSRTHKVIWGAGSAAFGLCASQLVHMTRCQTTFVYLCGTVLCFVKHDCQQAVCNTREGPRG